jgi:polar amino acid transport system substrate-binding protein
MWNSIGRRLLCVFILMMFEKAALALELKPIPLLLPEVKGAFGTPMPVNPEAKRLVDFFERESGLQFVIKTVPWNRVKWMVENGEGIAYGISKSPERLPLYRYSLPIQNDKVWAITLGETRPTINSVLDLRGRKIIMTRGTSYGLEFEQLKGKLFEVEENYESNSEHLLGLIKDPKGVVLWSNHERMNADQFTKHFNTVVIKSYKLPALASLRFNVSAKPIFIDSTHFVSGKGKYMEEMDKLDKAIRRLTNNGGLEKFLFDTRK